ncbi:MAG: hypothetical protein KC505_10610 [Myxococcales bacterium]|nr:hypothetical protein [Myxococcales bacterium]USN51590.1 MAG: hypothetical protein H6731_04045 [Myxococcales bacterium]
MKILIPIIFLCHQLFATEHNKFEKLQEFFFPDGVEERTNIVLRGEGDYFDHYDKKEKSARGSGDCRVELSAISADDLQFSITLADRNIVLNNFGYVNQVRQNSFYIERVDKMPDRDILPLPWGNDHTHNIWIEKSTESKFILKYTLAKRGDFLVTIFRAYQCNLSFLNS